MTLCNGKIKISKKDISTGINNDCHNIATSVCEYCGKEYCYRHTNRDKHNCDDSVKGCHNMLQSKEVK